MHCLYLFIPKAKTWGCKAATAAALPRCDVIAKVLRGHVETRHLDRRLSLEIFPHRWGRNEWPTTDQNSLNFSRFFPNLPSQTTYEWIQNLNSEMGSVSFTGWKQWSWRCRNQITSPLPNLFYINICWKQNHGDLRFQISFIFPAWCLAYRGQLKVNRSCPAASNPVFKDELLRHWPRASGRKSME